MTWMVREVIAESTVERPEPRSLLAQRPRNQEFKRFWFLVWFLLGTAFGVILGGFISSL